MNAEEHENALERILEEQVNLRRRLHALEESSALKILLGEQAELKKRLDGLDREISVLRLARATGGPHGGAAAENSPPSGKPATPIRKPPPLPASRPAAVPAPAPAMKSPTPGPVPISKSATSKAVAAAAHTVSTSSSDDSGGIEFQVGTYSLVRIGMVMILTGLVFFANYFVRSENIGPGVKVFVLYLASFALLGAGAFIERTRDRMRNYGQVLAAGGLAAVYFTTYAAHKVPALTVISSPLLAGLLLLLWAGFMVFLADWKKSQTLAVMGVLLAYYTLLIDNVSLFSLWSALILSGVALAFIVRNRWIVVGFVSLAGTYLSFAYWRYPFLVEWLNSNPIMPGSFWPEYGFLICYWAIFTAAAFLSSQEKLPMERRSAFAGINNAAFLLLFGLGMIRHYPDAFWIFSIVSGAIALALYELAERRFERDSHLSNMFLVKGLALLTLGFLIKLSGVSLALTLAAESSVLLVIALRRNNPLLEAGAHIAAILAVLYTLVCELEGPGAVWFLEFPGNVPGLAAIGQMLFLFFNAWWVRYRDRQESAEQEFAPRVCFYVALGVAAATFGALLDVAAGSRPLAFLVAGVLTAAAGTIGRFRLRELAVLGQAFSILGIWFFLTHHFTFERLDPLTLWQSVPVLAALLALTHWSAHEHGLPAGKPVRRGFQIVFALAFTLCLTLFANVRFDDPSTWLYAGGLVALAQLFFGFKTRLVMLAGASQLYHLAAALRFFRHDDGAFLSSLPIALLIVNLLVIAGLRHRPVIAQALTRTRRAFIETGLFLLRSIGLLMFIIWVGRHVGEPWQPFVGGAAAVILFVLALLRCDGQRLLFSMILLVLSALGVFIGVIKGTGPGQWQWYLACLVPLCMQQIQRRLPVGEAPLFPDDSANPGREPVLRRRDLAEGLNMGFALLGVGLLLLVLSRDVDAWRSGFYLTVSWSLLAAGVFVGGWVLRERIYRLVSLAILGAALARILLIDVWALDQVARIVSFIVIGVVLLALGFVYTRFQERLRRYF